MIVTHEIVSLQAFLTQNKKPASVIPREDGFWLVRDLPIRQTLKNKQPWSFCQQGDYVRIPLYPYQTGSKDPVSLLGFAWQLGFEARDDLVEVCGVKLHRLHILLGHPLEDAGPVFRFWLGFGAYVEKG